MNEAMKAELEGMDGDYKKAVEDDKNLSFRAGEQNIYISDYHFDRAKKGQNAGKPILIAEFRGAEKRNKSAMSDLVFTILTEASRGGVFHREKLAKFLKGFGIKAFDLGKLDDVFGPLVNKVFKAKINFDKNDYISIQPLKLVGEREVDDGTGEAPF